MFVIYAFTLIVHFQFYFMNTAIIFSNLTYLYLRYLGHETALLPQNDSKYFNNLGLLFIM